MILASRKHTVLNIVRQLDFGGVEQQCVNIAENSDASAYVHKFIAISHEGEAGKRIRATGADVICLSSRSRIPSILTIIRLVREIKRRRADIVHTRGSEANFHGIVAARISGAKVVVAEEVGIPTHSEKAVAIFRLLYKLTHRFVAISYAVKDAVVALREVPSEKVTVIYNPVIPPGSSMSPSYFAPLRIAFVGRLEQVKNPVSLVRAIKILSDEGQDVFLDIVGDGSLRLEIKSLVDQLGISDLVKLHGFLAQPFSALIDCNLYIQPSLTEGFGIALVEAGMCGLPLLVSANGGTVEIIDHGRNGWLLEGVSPEEIAKGVRAFINLPDEQKRSVARTGQQELKKKYTVENYMHALDDMYTHLLGDCTP